MEDLDAYYKQIPDYLQRTYDMLKCAFPDNLSEDEYWALVSLIHPYMSFRAGARVLGVLTGKHWAEVYNDFSGFGLDPLPDPNTVERVRQKLLPCGFDEWVKDDTF